jgi:N utilization substance protein A
MLVALGEKGVKSLDDLADLASDELIDGTDGILKDFNLPEAAANAIVMAARAHWFEGEDAPVPRTGWSHD